MLVPRLPEWEKTLWANFSSDVGTINDKKIQQQQQQQQQKQEEDQTQQPSGQFFFSGFSFFSSHFRIRSTLKYLSFFMPDLWLLQLSTWWIRFLQISVSIVGGDTKGNNRPASLSMKNFDFRLKFLREAFHERSTDEEDRWKEQRISRLPSYQELASWEFNELINKKCGFWTSLMYVVAGVGHFSTEIGRRCWVVVFYNYFIWVLISVGIWTEGAAYSFDLAGAVTNAQMEPLADNKGDLMIHSSDKTTSNIEAGKSDSNASENRGTIDGIIAVFFKFAEVVLYPLRAIMDKPSDGNAEKNEDVDEDFDDYKGAISAIVLSRSMIFQIIPQLAVLTEFVNMTSETPLRFHVGDAHYLRNKAGPFFNWAWALKSAEEKEFIKVDKITGKVDYKGISWIVYLRAVTILVEASRVIQYPKSIYSFMCSLGILFGDQLGWLRSTLVILLPFAILKSALYIIFIGKRLKVKDSDLIFWRALTDEELKKNEEDENYNNYPDQSDNKSNFVVNPLNKVNRQETYPPNQGLARQRPSLVALNRRISLPSASSLALASAVTQQEDWAHNNILDVAATAVASAATTNTTTTDGVMKDAIRRTSIHLGHVGRAAATAGGGGTSRRASRNADDAILKQAVKRSSAYVNRNSIIDNDAADCSASTCLKKNLATGSSAIKGIVVSSRPSPAISFSPSYTSVVFEGIVVSNKPSPATLPREGGRGSAPAVASPAMIATRK